jgi:hypothetical protein
MLELVLTVCSITQGAHCRDLSPIVFEQQIVSACVMASQIEGAKWVMEHPNYYVQKATCQPAGRRIGKA